MSNSSEENDLPEGCFEASLETVLTNIGTCFGWTREETISKLISYGIIFLARSFESEERGDFLKFLSGSKIVKTISEYYEAME